MRLAWLRKQGSGWLPTFLVLTVVLIAGSRLIYLSVQHHALNARLAAGTLAAAYADSLQPQLRKLVELAAAQDGSDEVASKTFRMSTDGNVLAARPMEAATAAGIAGEWSAAQSQGAVAGTSVLGPLRLGSAWVITARAPTGPGGAWTVGYMDLEDLIGPSRLSRLVDQGYDFQLSQVEPRSARTRIFVGSTTDELSDTVAVRIALPNGVTPAIPGTYLQIALRPHAGWYPSTQLSSDIALLVFLAWLLAFGIHDMGHELERAQTALGAARRRLHTVNQRLTAEMQQRLSLQESIDHARFHDPFTGLPNRRYFMDQLDRALRDVRTKRRQRLAVVIVDISRFKLVNDMLGHTAGDELMVQAARRFGERVSAFEGVLARWGGDQFAVLILDPATADAALHAAGALQSELRSPFELRRHRLIVSATVGVTLVDSGQQRAEDVVREADIALSVAKRRDSGRLVLYAPTMAGQAASLVSLEADLHVAMERRELQLLFQPIVDLRTYQMVGAEALLRWRHPVESVLTPDKFLSIAENAGLMVPITRWIITRVIRLAGEWQRRLTAAQKFFISVNVSPAALLDPGLGEYVAAQLKEAQLPASMLKFELTEAALISNAGAARETLDKLHSMGLQLMLDDFGTGYSSLSYLQLFPFDFVKIDRPFVNRRGADQANSGMMAAMVQMAGSLKLTSIAEIIETEAAARALQAMGCDYAQGYYFSEPLEAEVALQRLRTQDPFKPRDVVSSTPAVRSPVPGPAGVPAGVPAGAEATPAALAAAATSAAMTIERFDTSASQPLETLDASATQPSKALEAAAQPVTTADSSPTRVVKTVDSSPTQVVRPVDASPTRVVKTLDSSPTQVVKTVDASPTRIVKVIDSSPTRIVEPADSSATQVVNTVDTSATQVVEPLDSNGSTQAVRPLDPASASDDEGTLVMPPGSVDVSRRRS